MLTGGAGYTVAYNADHVIQFSGNPYSGTINLNVSDNDQDWNLLGNPYPAAISVSGFQGVNASGLTPSVYGTVYFWDESTARDALDYSSFNSIGAARGNAGGSTPNGNISSGQGFFVQSKAKTGNSISFTPSMQNTGNNQFFIPGLNNDVRRFRLDIFNSDSSLFNEILIGFTEDAGKGFDNLYDGIKLSGNPRVSMYSGIENETIRLAIQGLPLLRNDETMIVPLGIDLQKNEELMLKAETENMDSAIGIYLIDHLLNSMTELTGGKNLKIKFENQKSFGRFSLAFVNRYSTMAEDGKFVSPIIIAGRELFTADENLESVELLDLSGKLIRSFLPGGRFLLDDIRPGVYLLRITSSGQNILRKIVLF